MNLEPKTTAVGIFSRILDVLHELRGKPAERADITHAFTPALSAD